MPATRDLHELGQSLWLDNITREILDDGTLQRYIDDLSVTGLTSNPSIFQKAIGGSDRYDDQIRELLGQGLDTEPLFFELAIRDLQRAADLFKPIHEATGGVDGWVSLEVSPLLANDTENTIAQAKELHARAGRENLYIKVPGTREGLPAIEELIFAGVPINVTLLFSREHYLAAAEAYTRGVERRVEAGLDPFVCSVASLFISRWDKGTADVLQGDLRNAAGIAIGERTYKSFHEFINGDRWTELKEHGAKPQRLLMASTGTKDPALPDTLYVTALAAPETVNTMPEKTLLAFADHGSVDGAMPTDGGDCEAVLAGITGAGVDLEALAEQLQVEGRDSFDAAWHAMIADIAAKAEAVARG
ncbi:MAG: transaldolase [Planctomycetaceae bacterium]|nr:transaldolase [Planctomycetaceae bacterium]